MYDISGKMAPLARDMAVGFDLWRRNSKTTIDFYLGKLAIAAGFVVFTYAANLKPRSEH